MFVTIYPSFRGLESPICVLPVNCFLVSGANQSILIAQKYIGVAEKCKTSAVTQMLTRHRQWARGTGLSSWQVSQSPISAAKAGSNTWTTSPAPAALGTATAPRHTQPRHPTDLTQVCWTTSPRASPAQAVPLSRVVVPLSLPAPVWCVVPLHLLCHYVVRAHRSVWESGRQSPPVAIGNRVLLPHSSLVMIARLAIDLKSPCGRQHKQDISCFKDARKQCFPQCVTSARVLSRYGCLFRELGCHRLRLKRADGETNQEWQSPTQKLPQQAILHKTSSLLDMKKPRKWQLCYHCWLSKRSSLQKLKGRRQEASEAWWRGSTVCLTPKLRRHGSVIVNLCTPQLCFILNGMAACFYGLQAAKCIRATIANTK